MDFAEKARLLLLGGILAIVLVIALQSGKEPGGMAWAANSSAPANGMIMAIGGPNNDVVYVMDARNNRLLAYEFEKRSGAILLRGARDYSYDLRAKWMVSKNGMDYEDVKKSAKD